MILTTDQKQAVRDIKDWFHSSSLEFFLSGFAGTGKTTLVEHIINELKIGVNEVAFCAFTGKASLVLTLRAGGKYQGYTIHRVIYEARRDDETGLYDFILRNHEDLAHIRLIVVDEASMVSDDLYEDLKYFGIKLLFVGDHGQLPPVGKGTMVAKRIFSNPDAVLTTIHRQAEENPIIKLSMMVREGVRIRPGVYGDNVLVIRANDPVVDKAYLSTDQVIVGRNITREAINNWYRAKLGYSGYFPVVGDKLICLRNNYGRTIELEECDISLVNGMIGYVTKVSTDMSSFRQAHPKFPARPALQIDFKPDFTGEIFRNIAVLEAGFLGQKVELLRGEYRVYDDFTFGYAITGHKSQGSQWNSVTVLDESWVFREDRYRWLYTVITRAINKLILILN